MPPPGQTALYRPVPGGFDELFVRVGWSSIEAETQAHAKTIAKWLALRNSARAAMGLITLQEARAEHVRRNGPAKNPARVNYVMGRTNRRQRLEAEAPAPHLRTQTLPARRAFGRVSDHLPLEELWGE